MKVLGMDFGLANIGLAIMENGLVEPLAKIKYKDEKKAIAKINKICKKEEVELLVVGMPKGKMVNRIRGFAKRLGEKTGLGVEFEDESFTSREAVKRMIEAGKPMSKRRKEQDMIAACIILESWREDEDRRPRTENRI